MLDKGDSIGLIACSDAIRPERKEIVEEVENTLYDMGYKTVAGDKIFKEGDEVAAPAKVRAKVLMDMVANPDVKVIFDVSGGDVTNEILEYIDFDLIEDANKPIFAYSDVTSLLNAIYHKTGVETYLYQIRNIISEHGERQKADLEMTLSGESDDIYDIDYEFVQGKSMKGTLIGGNVRCFLKLAGTGYMPSFKHKVLFLESYSGKEARIRSYFSQLKQMGAFNEINGVLLGTFTELTSEGNVTAAQLLIEICGDDDLPIAVTDEVGHGADSKAVVIGKEIELH